MSSPLTANSSTFVASSPVESPYQSSCDESPTPHHKSRYRRFSPRIRPSRHNSSSVIRWSLIAFCVVASIYFLNSIRLSYTNRGAPTFHYAAFGHEQHARQLQKPPSFHRAPDQLDRPQSEGDEREWIRKHATMRPGEVDLRNRPKAAIISLVRNEELDGILQSMRQLEWHWNRRWSYPWIFFSETQFTEGFIAATTNATKARTEYHLIPRAHWTLPKHNKARYHNSLSTLPLHSIGKSHLPSYRLMCRWNSRFFYNHPALLGYDYYWRVEPDVHFFCDIGYDVFRFMKETRKVYGFVLGILDDARSFVSVWREVLDYIRWKAEHGEDVVKEQSWWKWLVNDQTGEYNGCQFFSNFEVGDLRFFRDTLNEELVQWLDGGKFDMMKEKANSLLPTHPGDSKRDLPGDVENEHNAPNGFLYERLGDAPVHTLSVSLFARRDQVWYFGDIGYQHGSERVCDAGGFSRWLYGTQTTEAVIDYARSGTRYLNASFWKDNERSSMGVGAEGGLCTCDQTKVDDNFYKLVPMESPQEKPEDSCLRLWLSGAEYDRNGGDGEGLGAGKGKSSWLTKKEGWSMEAEKVLGGDGLGGYVRHDF